MLFTKIISALPLVASLSSAFPQQKRALTDTTLYAYGTNISGIPIVYSSGLAYISNDNTTFSSLSWNISKAAGTEWTASFSNGTSVGSFYIVDGASTYEQAGFIGSGETSTVNATTIGFSTFGGQVVLESESALESTFWAKESDTDGVWSLMWNSAGTTQDNSIPVTLKTVAPSTST